MMTNVRDLVSSVRDSRADIIDRLERKDFLHRLGGGSNELIHRIGGEARHVGRSAAGLARNVGGSTADLARRIGPRRGLIGLAILGAVVGGTIVLVRYLRARAESEEAEDAELDATEDPQTGVGRRTRKVGRARRKTSDQVTH